VDAQRDILPKLLADKPENYVFRGLGGLAALRGEEDLFYWPLILQAKLDGMKCI